MTSECGLKMATGEVLMGMLTLCAFTVSVSTPWLCCHSTVLQDITTGGKLSKGYMCSSVLSPALLRYNYQIKIT